MHDEILPLTNETLNKLKEKHPTSKNANNNVFDWYSTGCPLNHVCKYPRGNDKKSYHQSKRRIWTFGSECR